LPHAKDFGHRLGTASWIAFNDACSPSNITAAPLEEEVLTKTDVEGVVIRKVDENPPPPCLDISAVSSIDRARRIAGSTEDGIFKGCKVGRFGVQGKPLQRRQ